MKLKDLVKALTKKEGQDDEVEFLVIRKSGQIVVMNVEAKAKDIIKVLKHFPKGE